MRVYLDTNTLVFLWNNQVDDISPECMDILSDYANMFYTSSVCLAEFIHLLQVGKFDNYRNKDRNGRVMDWFKQSGIELVPVTMRHLEAYECMPVVQGHRDPNDRLIIAQAISDHAALMSSDLKFANYKPLGLNLIFNKR